MASKQAPPRRNEVIRCENCGEDYSVTYKRCPFCDERPGRAGVSGKRVANTRGGGYGRPASTLRRVSFIWAGVRKRETTSIFTGYLANLPRAFR